MRLDNFCLVLCIGVLLFVLQSTFLSNYHIHEHFFARETQFNQPSNVRFSEDADNFVNNASMIFNLPRYDASMAKEVIKPVPWNCDLHGNHSSRIQERRHQPIYSFVHVYKCAGSTLRDFFLKYASSCHRGWTTLINCTNAHDTAIALGKPWMPCKVKNSLSRDGTQYFGEKSNQLDIDNRKIEKDVDIFGGHFKLGVGDHLKNPVNYITFLREPKVKFVSSKLYIHRDASKDEIMRRVKSEVQREMKKGRYYMRVGVYLLTPAQAERLKDTSITEEKNLNSMIESASKEAAHIIIDNLIRRRVVVGLTEAISDSMAILQTILDPRKQMTELFEQFGMVNKTESTAETNVKVSNKSRFSSSEILKELEMDDKFKMEFEEWVKYEAWVYNAAVSIHEAQRKVALGY
jgi:hypothetical protein